MIIRTLKDVRENVSSFHHDCHEQATKLAQKINVDVKAPRICGRQSHRRNALPSTAVETPEQMVMNYFRVNVTIPILDDIITSLQERFSDGQDTVIKGTMLLPCNVITNSSWKNILQPCVKFYSDEISCCHGVESELQLWSKMWEDQWKSHWKALNEQHLHTIGACSIS